MINYLNSLKIILRKNAKSFYNNNFSKRNFANNVTENSKLNTKERK